MLKSHIRTLRTPGKIMLNTIMPRSMCVWQRLFRTKTCNITYLNTSKLNSLTYRRSSSFVSNGSPFGADFPSDHEEEIKKRKEEQNNQNRDQQKHSYRPKIDPRETSIILFPGQGSQYVGMVKSLLPYPNVKEMFQYASDILKYDLLDVCLFGPKEKLNQTVFCQPAVLVTSLAFVEKLREENPAAITNCIATAGFSVGEISALTFAGVMSFEEAVELVRVRANAMQQASEMSPSGMMTTILQADHQLKYACLQARLHCKERHGIQNPVCSVANFLYPSCKVVAGHNEALEYLEKHRSEYGIRRVKRLPVSGAFHSDLMRPAVPSIKKYLKEMEFEEPLISVHSNVTGHKYGKSGNTARILTQQVYEPVKWEQTMHVLFARRQGQEFPRVFEMGPGRQLGTILRNVNGKAYEYYTPLDT